MSGSSRDYYYSSSNRSRGSDQPPHLPPIRDVIGDVLEQPARPTPDSMDTRHSTARPHTSTYAPSSQVRVTPPSRGHQSVQLPPIQPSRPNAAPSGSGTHYSSSTTRGYQSYTSSSSRPPPPPPPTQRAVPPRRENTPAHSYDLFQVVPSSQGLVHKRTSTRDDFHQITKEDAISSSTGRHICPTCGRRFEKLSTLKNHLTTHSGERPHECPECGRTFSVASNMKRHQQTHKSGGDRTGF